MWHQVTQCSLSSFNEKRLIRLINEWFQALLKLSVIPAHGFCSKPKSGQCYFYQKQIENNNFLRIYILSEKKKKILILTGKGNVSTVSVESTLHFYIIYFPPSIALQNLLLERGLLRWFSSLPIALMPADKNLSNFYSCQKWRSSNFPWYLLPVFNSPHCQEMLSELKARPWCYLCLLSPDMSSGRWAHLFTTTRVSRFFRNLKAHSQSCLNSLVFNSENRNVLF